MIGIAGARRGEGCKREKDRGRDQAKVEEKESTATEHSRTPRFGNNDFLAVCCVALH